MKNLLSGGSDLIIDSTVRESDPKLQIAVRAAIKAEGSFVINASISIARARLTHNSEICCTCFFHDILVYESMV